MAADKEGSSRRNRLILCSLCLLFSTLLSGQVTEAVDCTIGGFNLTRLQTFNPWKSGHNKTDLAFDINICDASKQCSNGISVTGYNQTSNSTLSYGTCDIFNHTTQSENGDLMVMVRDAPCPVMPAENLTAVIYFKCGKTMGQPVYLGDFGCSVYFEWESFEFCKDIEHPANEIPCYIFNNSQLIDLSPLTKVKGGYMVDQENGREYHINVCRDITPDSGTGTGACPQGSGACRVMGGSGVSFGRATSKLQVVGEEVKMTYKSSVKPAGCLDLPVTTISFRCPERGGSKEPQLLSDFECDVQILWWTEYACPQHMLVSPTCQLTMETHNVDIDISPLAKPPGSPYHVEVTTASGEKYDYYLNVCDQLGIACGKDHKTSEAVCQVKKNDQHSPGKILGDPHHKTLRYSDRQLSLTLKNGDICHTNFRRTTIINFHCKQDASDGGKGYPEFVEEQDCTYIFDWKTRFACGSHPPATTCHVQHEGKLFDLSDLTVAQGNNWLALADQSGEEDNQYLINVCHDLLPSSRAHGCPAGAAICKKDSSKSVSLGSYSEGLKYDPVTQKVYINYTTTSTSDHQCSGIVNTLITFMCKPGDLESGPALVEKSGDECVYHFEWYTAAACPMSHHHGTHCSVVDTQAGFSFDLSGLARASGEGYKVSDGTYDYYINVCRKLGGDHCQSGPHSNAAVCQVKKDNSAETKTGEPSETLEYYNGVLNLTYTNGEPYNDDNHTPRKTEIAFVCDMEAGAGHPEFLTERDQTYSFKWLTSYACPAPPIECVARDDNGKEYDLSSLSKAAGGDNWVVLDDRNTSYRHTYYINVCRPLAPILGLSTDARCDHTAAVCQTSSALKGDQESVTISSLGQARSGPKVKVGRETYLSLEYTGGALCKDGGEGARYNSTIHFVCSPEQQSRGPSPPRKVGPCSYEMVWDTSAACALKETDSGDSDSNNSTASCSISSGEYTYNLASLKKRGEEFYTAQSADKSRTFRLNICGSVSSSNCGQLDSKAASVCEVGSSANTGLTFADTVDLRFTENNNILLTYTGHRNTNTGTVTEVQLELACNRDADDSTPITFVSQRLQTYLFRLETPISCPPQPVDCMVQDRKGHQYDLSPLGKLDGFYDVVDSRASHTDLHYHINVCRPIAETPDSACPGGPIGGCQTGGKDSYSLGYIQSKPHVAEDGTITLRYVGGSVCHRGTPQQAHRSMRINFYCSHVEGSPQFVGESDICEYSFTWATPSACPQQRSTGQDCKVSDPLFNFQFDLTSLHKTTEDYNVTAGEFKFLLNVCGALHSPPSQCSGMGSCQTGDNLIAPVAAGKANSKLIYDAGELSLVYTEGKASCHGRYQRKTIITFVCDHSKTGAGDGPQYMHELEDCTYTFVWATDLACPPHRVVDCSYTDPKTGNKYDLSSLALSDANYVKQYGDVTYIINVCRSLVHRKGETCPFNSAACMINGTQKELTKKYQSLGEVTTNPVSMEDGKLVMRYMSGAPCSKGGNMTTLIILSCPTSSDALEGGPGSHFVRDFCQHGFVWNTKAACPAGSTDTDNGPTTLGDCKASNPLTHYEFDLSKLKKSVGGYQVNDREGHYFYINVCGPVSNGTCENTNSGSCQVEINGQERSFNAGNANGNLEYVNGGVLTLNYSGGEVCHHNNVSRTTIINFVCHQGAGDGTPTFVDSSDGCLYYFDWHTELVCETRVPCEVNTGSEVIDLTPLVKESGHHLAIPDLPGRSSTESRGRFYINICRPLNPIFNTLCPAGAAACREVNGQPPQSLGRVRAPPTYNTERKEVVLIYDHGKPCTNNPEYTTSSRIIFTCKQGPSQGEPRLVEISGNCEYVFEWATNVVCRDDAVEKETSNCTYYDERTDYTFDLSALKDLQQVDSPQGGKLYIQACGALPANLSSSCKGAAVCLVGSKGLGSNSLQDGSYGQATSGTFQMDGETLKLSFVNGHKCQFRNATARTTILFECDYSAGNGRPVSLIHTSCDLTFQWRTSLICPPLVEDCAVTSGDITIDLAVLSQPKNSWEFDHIDGSRYWINLCQAVHGEASKQSCPPTAAVCRRTKDGRVDMLGDLKSQKIHVEGDGTVVIEYSQGTSACSSGRRRSNNPLARSIIRLVCGTTVGSPVLKTSQNLEQCLFEFTWATRAVCKQDSMPRVLQDINKVIYDPRSGAYIDLRSLLKGGNHHAFDHQSRYMVSLEGHLYLDHKNPASSVCSTAAVCEQRQNDANYYRNLGTYTSHQYYLNEDQLEVVYTSSEKCGGHYSHKNITSIITFSCSSNIDTRTDPVFRYSTVDCTYLFNWDTPAACMQAKVEVATGGTNGDSQNTSVEKESAGVNKTTLITVVSVFSTILVVCFLAVYCHKPERRAAAASRFRRIILCRKTTENQIRYSVLSQMEEDPEVDPVGTNPFEDDLENELQNGDTMGVKGFHDDSDDDMLL